MKTKLSLLLTFLLSSFLFGCNSEGTNEYFTGTIEEIYGDIANVYIVEGSDISTGGRVTVDLSVNSEVTFEVGDRIGVTYDGWVGESSPLSIKTLSVELLE